MKTLAKGKNQKTTLKLLRILINTSQSHFVVLNLDDSCIRDIADVITAEKIPSEVEEDETVMEDSPDGN